MEGSFLRERMSAHTDNERSEAAVDVPRLVRQIELMGEVVDAAKCIRHWHDSGKEGMVVSNEHVFKLWKALNNLEANAKDDRPR